MTVTSDSYQERDYEVIKVALAGGPPTFLVVSRDLTDPDVWALICQCNDPLTAWRYIAEVKDRNRMIAREMGCNA